jgi:hypothetical protein
MKAGVDQYLDDHGLSEVFTVTLVHQPDWPWVVDEVVRSEDVVLLLGFWEYRYVPVPGWYRLGGHYVTVAGVDPVAGLIGFSDPFFDQAELGWPWLGRVLSGTLTLPHAPIPGHPAEIHNDAGNISHDVYHMAPSPSPGGTWGPAEYPADAAWEIFYGLNGLLIDPEPGDPPPEPGIYTEVEWALAVSPLVGLLDGKVMDSERSDLVPTCTPATVQIEPGSLAVPADTATGYYGPVPLLEGTYTVTATAPGYSTETATNVQVTRGATTTQNFSLRRPVIEVTPTDLISVTAIVSVPVTHRLTISNNGHLPLEFEIVEQDATGVVDLPWVSEAPDSGTIPVTGWAPIDVTFICTEPVAHIGGLVVRHNDPCLQPLLVPIHLHCKEPPPPVWDKWVNGQLWEPNLEITVETSDTITVTDVFTALGPFRLEEYWMPAHLDLREWHVEPAGHGEVSTPTGYLIWDVPLGPPEVMTITKIFHVEPCTWTETTLTEELWIGQKMVDQRLVGINKRPPDLWIDAVYDAPVYAGYPASFMLQYGNNGGNENKVVVWNTFPWVAPFVGSDPPPTDSDPLGSFAKWAFDELASGQQGSIDVTVAITPNLQPSTTIQICAFLHDHTDVVADASIIYHVEQPPVPEWEKLVDGQPWSSSLSVTVETSQTIEIIDTFVSTGPFALEETWNTAHLSLEEWFLEPLDAGVVLTEPGRLLLEVPPGPPEPVRIIKRFHVKPCNWPATELQEELWVGGTVEERRPVHIVKNLPVLLLESDYEPEVVPGEQATFTLTYSNEGGLESAALISNEFPPEALFVSSVPEPTEAGNEGTWARWQLVDLPGGTDLGLDLRPRRR